MTRETSLSLRPWTTPHVTEGISYSGNLEEDERKRRNGQRVLGFEVRVKARSLVLRNSEVIWQYKVKIRVLIDSVSEFDTVEWKNNAEERERERDSEKDHQPV